MHASDADDAPSADGVETLGDLVFRLRTVAAGRAELLRVTFPDRGESLSTADFLRAVHCLAVALDDRGVRRNERVAILSENRPEWHVADFACQLLGVATVPIFPGLAAEQVAYVLRNSGCRWIFYSDAGKRDLLAGLRGALTQMPVAIAFDPGARLDEAPSFTGLQGEGATRIGEVPLERFRGRAAPDDLASLLYTSGTTGDPKGVMLSHRNFLSNVRGCAEVFDVGPADLAISFLPLSHVFQRTVDLLCFYRGVSIHYVPFVDDVPATLRTRSPTVMAAAPAVYERAYRRSLELAEAGGRLRAATFRWALGVGKRWATASREGFVGPLLALQQRLARRLAFASVQARFGGRMRFAISGGAPLADEVTEFFDAVGIPLFQGYGLTETSPVLATNHPRGQRLGSVGKVLSDVELRIAADGEILVRGPGVMKGYWQDPGGTAASIDESGWFRTGDVGRLDRSGYLFVTDRKRDLLVTATGENVAPRPIELLLAADELIAQAVVVGDGRPFAAALLVPDFARLAELLAVEPSTDEATRRQWLERPEVRREIAARVEAVNQRLATPSRLGAWCLLPRAFGEQAGELTPTGDVRRKAVLQRHAQAIDAMYEATAATSETPATAETVAHAATVAHAPTAPVPAASPAPAVSDATSEPAAPGPGDGTAGRPG